MYPAMRDLGRAFLAIFSFFFVVGCQEYNANPTVSEAASLAKITQLTNGFDRAGDVILSPDQRWILFRAIPPNQHTYGLYLAKLSWDHDQIVGLERPLRITPPKSQGESGSFSVDGLTLILSCTGASTATESADKYPLDMRIFRVDGWEGAISMTDAVRGIDFAKHPLLADRAYNSECSFSPDGQHIVFTSTRDGKPNLYLMHADGSHVIRLIQTDTNESQPSFSPDGKRLLYCSDRDANHLSQIYTADLVFDGSEITGLKNEKALTWDDNINTNPAWYPDGKHIIYATSKHGRDNYELYLMDKFGRKKTRITFTLGADLFPIFTPDGRYLIWTSRRGKQGSVQVVAAKFQFPTGS